MDIKSRRERSARASAPPRVPEASLTREAEDLVVLGTTYAVFDPAYYWVLIQGRFAATLAAEPREGPAYLPAFPFAAARWDVLLRDRSHS